MKKSFPSALPISSRLFLLPLPVARKREEKKVAKTTTSPCTHCQRGGGLSKLVASFSLRTFLQLPSIHLFFSLIVIYGTLSPPGALSFY